MKDSGVRWLGGVPKHWEVRRLGTSVEGCINGIWGNDPNGSEDLPCVRVADFDRVRLRVRLEKPTLRAIAPGERNRRLLKKGDLLLEKSGGGDLQPVGVVMLYDNDAEAVCSNFVARMPVSARCDSSYLMYLHSHLYAIRLNVRSIKQTTGIQNLDSSSYLGEPVSFPPLPEQAAIVRFLDHANRRIRRYIRSKQKLITLLEEQKQALIHRAVTRGLDPNVRLKPSGAEWLGDVPEHWEVRRLKYAISFTGGGTPSKAAATFWSGHIPWVSPKDMTRAQLNDTADHITNDAVAASATSIVAPGAVLIVVRSGILRRTIPVAINTVPMALNQDMKALRPKDGIAKSEYLLVLIQGNESFLLREWTKHGATVESIEHGFLANSRVPLPPLPEQADIVRFLDRATAKMGAAIDRAGRQIHLLREYHTCLIADVVTGKLDVRAAAARLPDEDKETEPLDETDPLINGEEEPIEDVTTTGEAAV